MNAAINVPILMMRNDSGHMRAAVLNPETRHHNLFASESSEFTDLFKPTSVCVIVRGQFEDQLDADDINRVFSDARIHAPYDAILIDPSEVRLDPRRGSYDKWEHKVILCVKTGDFAKHTSAGSNSGSKSDFGGTFEGWSPEC